MSTPTSFVEEAQALHQKLQQLIEAASPNADKTQVNLRLLKEVASHLRATPRRLDSTHQLDMLTAMSSLTCDHHVPTTDLTLKDILDVVHQVKQCLIVGLCQGTYMAAAQRGASMTPDPQRQQAPQGPPSKSSKQSWYMSKTLDRLQAYTRWQEGSYLMSGASCLTGHLVIIASD